MYLFHDIKQVNMGRQDSCGKTVFQAKGWHVQLKVHLL